MAHLAIHGNADAVTRPRPWHCRAANVHDRVHDTPCGRVCTSGGEGIVARGCRGRSNFIFAAVLQGDDRWHGARLLVPNAPPKHFDEVEPSHCP